MTDDVDMEGAAAASMFDPGSRQVGLNVEAILEGFPGFGAVLAQIDLVPAAAYAPWGQCDRCGIVVDEFGRGNGWPNPRTAHTEWHRQLTIGIHLNAWLSNVVFQSIQLLGAGEPVCDVPDCTVERPHYHREDGDGERLVFTDADGEADRLEPRKTAREWDRELEEQLGGVILDWDGFRGTDEDQTWTEDEFILRRGTCTVRPTRPRES